MNWCENKLTVRGARNRIDAFLEAIVDPSAQPDRILNFERLLPTPPDLFDDHGGYDGERQVMSERCAWRKEHWGTARNADNCKLEVRRQLDECEFRFDTQSRPPVPLLDHLAAGWYDLSFELSWCNMTTGHAGAVSYQSGSQQCNLTYELGPDGLVYSYRGLHFCALAALTQLGHRLQPIPGSDTGVAIPPTADEVPF